MDYFIVSIILNEILCELFHKKNFLYRYSIKFWKLPEIDTEKLP
jgi:hypothetical protein